VTEYQIVQAWLFFLFMLPILFPNSNRRKN